MEEAYLVFLYISFSIQKQERDFKYTKVYNLFTKSISFLIFLVPLA